MALERSLVTIPLAQGLDTKTDPFQLSPGKLQYLHNGVFTTGKKIRKRYGTTAKPTSILGGGSIAAGTAIATLKNEILLLSSGSLYSWAGNSSTWSARGSIPPISLSAGIAFTGRGTVSSVRCAAMASGVVCYTYRDWNADGSSSSLVASLVDSASGAAFATVTVAAVAYSSAPVVAMESNPAVFVIAYSLAAKTYYVTLSAAGVLGTPVEIANWTTNYSSIGVVSTGSGASAATFLVFPNAAATDLSIRKLTSALSLGAAVAFGVAAVTGIFYVATAIDTNNGNVLVAFHGTSGTISTFLSVASPTPTVVVGSVLVEAALTSSVVSAPTVGVDSAGVPRVWYSRGDGSGTGYLRTSACPAYTPGTPSTVSRNTHLIGDAFVYGGSTYCFVQQSAGSDSTVVMNALTGAVVARANDGAGYTQYSSQSGLATPAPTASGVFVFPVGFKSSTTSVGGVLTASFGFRPYSFNLSPAAPPTRAELAGPLIMSCGIPWMYDGRSVVELGFHAVPKLITAVVGVGASMEAGLYQYAVTYEWTDATGAVHTSGVTLSSSLSVAATGSVTLSISTLRVSAKTGCRIAIHRTLTNGSILKRLAVIANDPTVDSVSFYDGSSGSSTSSLASAVNLYTTGGVLDNQPPPAFSAMTVYRNRLVGISAEDPRQIWYSKQVIPGQPIEFSDFLVLNLDPVGGEATALAALDDKLLIFKAGVVYYITGSGPDSTGAQNDFSVPILINTNSGCIEPRSVITAADGVMYQSAKGIYILDRSLQDNYIGFGVESYNADSVLAVVQVPSTNEVRFTLSGGVTLVYDFLFKQWSDFTGLAAIDSTVWGGAVHTLKSTGVVAAETPGVFTDNGTAITLSLVTGWLGAGDLQSFLRIYKLMILGSWKSSHTLNVGVGVDYRTDYSSSYAIPAAVDPSPAQFQYRINLARQKCEAIQLTIYDSATTGESLDLSAITFEVGVKKGPNRMPAARSV